MQNLKYALNHGAKIEFQAKRLVDMNRNVHYTNQYTVNTLFPNEDPVSALRRELATLTVQDYIKTVKDIRFKNKSEWREFGKVYNSSDDVYIKIKVELINEYGCATTFEMSFHFAEVPFTADIFPYRKS